MSLAEPVYGLENPQNLSFGTYLVVADGESGNAIPTIMSHGDTASLSGSVNETMNLSISASDVDGDVLSWSIPSQGSLGTVSFSGGSTTTGSDVTVSYLSANSGSDSFTIQVSDGKGGLDLLLVSVTVVRVNTDPVINQGDSYSISGTEDQGELNVTLSGTDGDGDTLTWSIQTQGSKGTATFGGASSQTGNSVTLRYVPDSNENGSDTVIVRINDGNGGTDSITINVSLSSVNDAPVIGEGDSYSLTVREDGGETNRQFAGTDLDGDALTWSIQTNPAKGSASVDGDGTVRYTPAKDEFGSDSFVVKVSDGSLSDTITVQVIIDSVNDAPSFLAGGDQNVLEDAGDQSVSNWATSISCGPANELGQTFQFTVSNNNAGLFSVQPSLSIDGTLTYTAKENINGTATVTIVLEDNGGTENGGSNQSLEATFTITIQGVNDAPIIGDGDTAAATISEDTTNTEFHFTATDVDNDTLTWSIVSGGGIGTATVGSNGVVSYSPNANVCGTDTFVVGVSDGTDMDLITVTVTITAVNDAPVIEDGESITLSIIEDSGLINQTLSATDADGDGLSWVILTGAIKGNATIDGSGTVGYTPIGNVNGSDSFVVQVSDGILTDTITVYVTIGAQNDAPSFIAGGEQMVQEDAGAQTIVGWASSLSSGPEDEAGQTLSFVVTNNNTGLFSAAPFISSDGTLTYTPAENANGTATVTVILEDTGGTENDGINQSGAVSFTITINSINDAPVITQGETASANITEDVISTGFSLTATDVDGDTLTWSIATNGAIGTATVTETGSVSYHPNADANGIDTFVVSVTDGTDTDTIIVTVTITSVNDAPSFTVGANQSINEDAGAQTISNWATNVSAGPADESGQLVTFEMISNSNPTLFSVLPIISSDGILSYTLADDAFGSTTIEIQLKDNGGGNNTSGIQSFNITAVAMNDAPSFIKGANQTVLEDAVAQTVSGWATSISAGPANESSQIVTFEVTGNTNPGLFSEGPSVSSGGTLTYTPALNANGTATITIRAVDDGTNGIGESNVSAEQSFTITMTPVNDAPTMTQLGALTIDEDTTTTWDFTIDDVESDENELILSYETSDTALLAKANIQITGTGANRHLTVTPTSDKSGVVSITLTIQDSNGASTTQVIPITVTSINDAPTIGTVADRTIEEDSNTGSIGIALSDVDTDVNTLTVSASSSNETLVPSSGIVIAGTGANRTLVITPASNQFGTSTITVTVSDGSLSAIQTFLLTVTAVNDAPTISGLIDVLIDEDHNTGAVTFTVQDADDDASTLTISAAVDNTTMIPRSNIVIAGTGENRTITLTPVPDKSGVATITISVRDGQGLVANQSFTLNVVSVNDNPTMSGIGNQITNEDTAKNIELVVADTEDAAGTLSVNATSNNQSVIPDANLVITGATGTRNLKITPASDASGTADITVVTTDSGGLTATETFTITVNASNDAPSFHLSGNQTKDEDCGTQTVTGFITDYSVGPADEVTAGQTVSYTVTNDNNSLFSVQPSISDAGVLTYQPAADANGSAEVSVKVVDNGGTSNGGTNTSEAVIFIITINPINDAPTAESMSIVVDTDEDQMFKGVLSASDLENDSLTYSIVTQTSHGVVALTDVNTGAFDYTPNHNYFGTDEFSFRVYDGALYSVATTVAIQILGVNDAPVANDSSASVNEDTVLHGIVTATDEDSTTIHYEAVYTPEHGTLSLDQDGNYTYTPDADFYGIDYFTFRATDMSLYSNTATVTITIASVNDAPIASDETIAIYRDQEFHGVLKATDPEKKAVTYSLVSTASLGSGTLILDNASTGVFTYKPALSELGTVHFTYRATDADGMVSDPKTVTITINDLNLAPEMWVTTVAAFSVNEDAVLLDAVTATDPNLGDTITYQVVSGVSHGTLDLIAATGAFTYTPTANFSGIDLFTVKATDSMLYTSTIIVKITVNTANDEPTAYAQVYRTVADTPVSGTLAGSDPEQNNLTYRITGATNGTVTSLNTATGAFTFAPSASFVGDASFTFVANDGTLDSNESTVIIHVFASDGSSGGSGGGSSTTGISPIADRTINEGATDTVTFTLTGFTNSNVTVTSANQTLVPNGNISILGTGVSGEVETYQITMNPVAYRSGKTVITISATGDGISDSITYNLTVLSVNDLPVATNKTLTMDQRTGLNEYVRGTDSDGDTLTYSVVSNPTHLGIFQFDNDGMFYYEPDEDYYGTDSFTYQAHDGTGTSATETVTINITKINKAPIVSSSSFSVDEDTVYNSGEAGKLVGYDLYGDTVTFELVTDTTKGTVAIDGATGTFTYTPGTNLNGVDAFSYRVLGSTGLYSETAVMNITINPINDAPVGVAKTITSFEDQTLNGNLQGTDIEESPLTFQLVTTTSYGALTLNSATGGFTYTPIANFDGTDEFYFKVNDGDLDSALTKIVIQIDPINDEPIASDGTITVLEDNVCTTGPSLSTFVTDVDTGDTHTYELIQNGSLGTIAITDAATGAYTYTPRSNQNGIDYFSFRVTDGAGAKSNVALVTVTITPENDAPTISGTGLWDVNEDSSSSSNTYHFTVGDIEDQASALIVTAVSNNTAFVKDADITLGGSAADRWIHVAPAKDAFGTTTLTITVWDSGADSTLAGAPLSASHQINLTINEVNDTPTINGQETNGQVLATVTIDEDTTTGPISFTIDDEESGSAPLILSATSGNTTLVDAATGVTFGGTGNSRTVTITPRADQNGVVRVTVSVGDGNSARTAYVDVTVNPVNDAPVVTPPADQTIKEDTQTDVLYFTLSDIDSNVENATVIAVSSDESKVKSSSITVSGNGAERTVHVVPEANAVGDVQIRLIANDHDASGINTTGQGIFLLHILQANDAPTIGAIGDVTVEEDHETGEITFSVGDLDSDLSSLTVSAISGNTSLITSSGITFGSGGASNERWIKLKPAPNQNGSGLISVIVSDGDKTSTTTFTLNVTPVNDAPTIGNILDQTILEDSKTGVITFNISDVDDDASTLTIIKGSSDETVIPTANINIVGTGSEKTIQITPLANQNGNIDITLLVTDPHGATCAGIFTVSVTPVNDIPSFTKGGNQTVLEDVGAQSVASWATNLSKGPINESSQSLSFTVTYTNSGLFSVAPAIDENGNLSYTPAANANGTSTVTVSMKDSGGTDNGGKDTTAIQTFIITVTAVNDAPSFTPGASQTVLEDATSQSISGWATNLSKGPSNESAQILDFVIESNSNPGLFSIAPAISSNGILTYTLAADANGTATIQYHLHDNGGTANGGANITSSASFTINVTAVNDAPVMTQGTSATTSGFEDTVQIVNLSATDVEGDSFTWSITSQGAIGTASVNSGGSVTYTPNENANGNDSLVVQVSDNNGGTDFITVNVTITPVNDAPSFTRGADQTVNEDAGSQSISWASNISKGPLNESAQTLDFIVTNDNSLLFETAPAIDSSGNLTYKPAENAHGTATVSVVLKDDGLIANGGVDTTAAISFSITVNSVNDAPVITQGDTVSINGLEDAIQIVSLAGIDVDGDSLTWSIGTNGIKGTASIDAATGVATYTPNANLNGSDSFVVQVSDGNGETDTITVNVTITPVNDGPTYTQGGNQTVDEDAGAQSVAWATNLSTGPMDEGSQTLSFVISNNSNTSLFASGPAISSTGVLTYTPVANAHGTATISCYLHDDGGTTNNGIDSSGVATFTITFNSINDAPVITQGDTASINGLEDAIQTISLGATDADGDGLSWSIVSQGALGIASVNGSGIVTYTPTANVNGSDRFSLMVDDGNGGTDLITVNVIITPVNDAPGCTPGSDVIVNEDAGAQSIPWASAISPGPTDESHQTLSFIVTNNSNTGLFSGVPVIGSDGTLTFTPAADANGTATISYYLLDSGDTANGGTNASTGSTFTITVNPVNDAPSFIAGGNQMVNEDEGTQSVSWATGILPGPANESLQNVHFNVTNDNGSLFETAPTIDSAGTLTFKPAANAKGTATVTVNLQDDGMTGNGGIDQSAAVLFDIIVTSINDVPVISQGAVTMITCLEDQVQTLTLNGTDDDGDGLTWTVETAATKGNAAVGSSTGIITYTPNPDENGNDSFVVRVSDGNGGADSITINVTITPVNDGPSFVVGANQTSDEDAGLQTVLGWATGMSTGPSDESAQNLQFIVTNNNPTLFETAPTIDSSGNLTYKAAADAAGIATVIVVLQDDGLTANGGINQSEGKAFTITITGSNDSPVITEGPTIGTSGLEDTIQTLTLHGTDADKDSLTWSITSQGSIGVAVIDGTGLVTYTPNADSNGSDVIVVTVSDGNGGMSSITINVTVIAVNDGPGFTPGANVTVGENTGLKIVTGWATAMSKGPTDESGQTLSFAVTNDNSSLFATQPAIDVNGNLTFGPAADQDGMATVTVVLQDDGGIANGGVATASPIIFTIKVVSSDDLSVIGYVRKGIDNSNIEGANVKLLDLAGNVIRTTATDAAGYYSFAGVKEERYIIEVTHNAYADNSRMTDVSFASGAQGVIQEDFLMADFTLELSANPTAILGNGTDTSELTAVVKDRNGNPIPDVVLAFTAAEGTFHGNTSVITNSNGSATITYIAADYSGSLSQINVPVTVTVNDPVKELYGSDRIYVTFAPGIIEGVVTDGRNSNNPIAGAIVKVYKDFDGDGIVDFSFEQVTGSDGKYRIVIPKGGVDYDILITKPVVIGGVTQYITVKQTANPGAVNGAGTSYPSDIVASGIIVMKKNGAETLVDDLTSYSGMQLQLVDALGNVIDISNKLDSSIGTFTTGTLAAGNYTIRVVYDLGNGDKLIAGSTPVTVTQNGEMNINEVLIDPYGTITDRNTNAVISGVKVELYYTATNTLVPLPALVGFPPSNNANPQYSDASGQYAFMVFPDTDYYIKASKSGYKDFVSGTISVGKAIVLYDFKMTPASSGGGGASIVASSGGIVAGSDGKDLAINLTASKMKVEENSNVDLTITYGNKTSSEVRKITVTATVPDGMKIVNNAGGKVSGNTIQWSVDQLAGNEIKTIIITLQAEPLSDVGSLKTIRTEISSTEELITPEDDQSEISLLLYSNRFEGIHERYMKGYPDGNFNSERNITRAEVATIFARLLKLDLTVTSSMYGDVDSSHWAAGYIQAVANAGLIKGYEDGTFAPDRYITRAELATVIARYFEIDRASSINPLEIHFTDTEESWADSNIEEVYRYAIVTGYEDGTFKPGNNILRSETVTMINRMLYRGPVENGEQRFLDTQFSDWYFGQVEEASKSHSYTINEDGSETVIQWIDDELQ